LSITVKASPVAGLSMSTAQASVPEGSVRGSSRLMSAPMERAVGASVSSILTNLLS
jgi:hypothetical protein